MPVALNADLLLVSFLLGGALSKLLIAFPRANLPSISYSRASSRFAFVQFDAWYTTLVSPFFASKVEVRIRSFTSFGSYTEYLTGAHSTVLLGALPTVEPPRTKDPNF